MIIHVIGCVRERQGGEERESFRLSRFEFFFFFFFPSANRMYAPWLIIILSQLVRDFAVPLCCSMFIHLREVDGIMYGVYIDTPIADNDRNAYALHNNNNNNKLITFRIQ